MRKALSLLLLFPLFGCSHHGSNLAKPSTQQDFGVEMARMNLWREAQFRFKRAVEINPADAMAHNNLAVALEANGAFENAVGLERDGQVVVRHRVGRVDLHGALEAELRLAPEVHPRH